MIMKIKIKRWWLIGAVVGGLFGFFAKEIGDGIVGFIMWLDWSILKTNILRGYTAYILIYICSCAYRVF